MATAPPIELPRRKILPVSTKSKVFEIPGQKEKSARKNRSET